MKLRTLLSSFLDESRCQKQTKLWGPRPMSWFEVGFICLSLAALFWWSFLLPTFTSEPHPKGLALLLPGENFTWLNQPQNYSIALGIVIACCGLLACNRLLWLALPILCFLHLSLGTLSNSQQEEPGHKFQLISLALLFLWAWDWFSRYQNYRRNPQQGLQLWRANSRSWWAHASWILVQVVAASYLVSVFSKLILSDGEWIARTANFPIQQIKTNLASWYGTLTGANPNKGYLSPLDAAETRSWLDSTILQLRHWFLVTPYAITLLLCAGLILEALAFLALRGRILSLILGIGLIGMHLGIQLLMQLHFEVHLVFLLLFFVNLPWLLSLLLPKKLRPKTL